MIHTKNSIRPTVHIAGSQENSSIEERFQNEILRPIIKLQHQLIVAFFGNYLERKKMEFTLLSPFKKKELIANAFQKDNQFKMELRGMIVGHFTLEEYRAYERMAPSLNKRIMSMLQERISSTI